MLESLKLFHRFLSPSSFFWILVSSFCSSWMFISSFCSKLLIWVLVSFQSVLVPCMFFSVLLCITFTFPLFWDHTQPFLWASWLPVFWTLHLIGWLYLHHLVLFLELWSLLSFGPYFFVSVCLLRSKGQSLRYLPGWGNPHCCVVALYVEEGCEREQCLLLCSCWLSATSSHTHQQIGPFWCWFPGWWVCVHFRTLWFCPTKSPVRLGVSSCSHKPHRSLQPEVLRLYFLRWNSGLRGLSCSPVIPPGLSACKCGTTWSASHCLTLPILQLPLSALLSVWMNVSSSTPWLSDFHTVQFSGSSGCFLFLNLLLSFFWLCKEAKCIYLRLHLGLKSVWWCLLSIFLVPGSVIGFGDTVRSENISCPFWSYWTGNLQYVQADKNAIKEKQRFLESV